MRNGRSLVQRFFSQEFWNYNYACTFHHARSHTTKDSFPQVIISHCWWVSVIFGHCRSLSDNADNCRTLSGLGWWSLNATRPHQHRQSNTWQHMIRSICLMAYNKEAFKSSYITIYPIPSSAWIMGKVNSQWELYVEIDVTWMCLDTGWNKFL